MEKNPQQDHWNNFAQQWNRLASPLRPCHEDVEIFRRNMAATGGLNLLLGVTPELGSLPGNLVPMDKSAAMIAALRAGSLGAGEHGVEIRAGYHAVMGDWLDMPFAARCFDNIVGDGSLTLLSYPSQYQRLFEQLGRIAKPGGKILIRFFVNPEAGETCADVCRFALGGQIAGFHAFKWRLSMAVAAETRSANISVAATWAAFNRLLPDRERLAAVTGWPMEDISTIDFYRGSTASYSYPALSQLRRTFPPHLRETGMERGTYELSDRCPIFIMEFCEE